MGSLKESIVQKLYNQDYKTLEKDFEKCLVEYPYDTDIFVLKAYYLLLKGSTDRAKELLQLVLSKEPFDVDAYYLLGETYAVLENPYEAIWNYCHAELLCQAYKENYLFYNSNCFEDKE